MYDVIIIGKGPAGISGALYTCRANLKTLIIGRDDSRLIKSAAIENYYGFAMPITGEYLIGEGIKQAQRFGAEILESEVLDVTYGDGYTVVTTNGNFEAKAIMIATGNEKKKLQKDGFDRFEGNGISYCTTCDGFFFRDKKVGVYGWSDFAVFEAGELMKFTKNITILTDGNQLNISEKESSNLNKFNLDERKIKAFSGGDSLESMEFADGTKMNIDGVFIAAGSASAADFARKLGISVKDDSITTDLNGRTSVPGIFAAGDCTGVFRQVSYAVGQGAIAGKSIIEYINKDK